NLPSRLKMANPRYQDIPGTEVKLLSSHDGGALLRLIAGEVGGHQGPGITHTPISVVHATVSPGAELRLPWDPSYNALVWASSGTGRVGSDDAPLAGGKLAVLGAGDVIRIAADEQQ